ncbi:MAG: 1-acyl-sn-glycerol-3-phosphate acyltransferase [Defluviitaleaceae bacterium]|nr:1-acyl-sn-glycerol-3-phosphate acyltransferase [Defluviitaleaceae bacterium]
MWKLARILCGSIYKILFRTKITGRENIPKEGGVILCANHTSNHDTVVLGLASPRDLNFLAKQELFENKLLGGLLLRLKGIPINREKPGMDSFKKAIGVLKGGEPLAIFMQGGRRKEMDTSDYKAGVALFAVKGHANVVPVNIKSTFRLFSKVRINIGEPICFEEHWGKKLRTEQLNEIAQKVMDAIVALEEV